MEDVIATGRVLIALAFYAAAYVLPLTIVISALLRSAFRWHSSWPLVIAGLFAALPQAAITAAGDKEPDWMLYGFTLLTLFAAILHWKATRAQRGAKILLEIAVFIAVLVYALSGLNWIVG